MMKIIMINYSDNDDDVDDAVRYCRAITNKLSNRIRPSIVLTKPIHHWALDAAYASDCRPHKAVHPQTDIR